MPRNYIPAFPDIRGQRYDRSLISETQSSPADTAGDVHGITGTRIVTGEAGEFSTPTVRRYRFRLGWDQLTTEEAVDSEYAAVELCADGSGVCPFIEWDVTGLEDYPGAEFALWPGRWELATPYVGPFHWWDFTAPVVTHDEAPVTTVFADDDSWLGNIPTFSIAAPSGDQAIPFVATGFTGRRIRIVTIEPGTYQREKGRAPDRWQVSVTLIEKETGIAPGYGR
jgi:hypothetical protein